MTGLPASAFTTPRADEATDERAWLQAMLDVERALALGAAQVGLIDDEAAQAVAAACDAESFDARLVSASLVAEATPVIEVVRQLRALVPDTDRDAVHVAATSQDVIDTAMVLVTHHVEEIPVGFSHALILSEGKAVASGLLTEVLTAENLSKAFGQSIALDVIDGRYFARRTRSRAAHRRRE